MEPRIQYARTRDGVSIAYHTIGQGPALVAVPDPPFSNIQHEAHYPLIAEILVAFGRGRLLVRFDTRGTGLSDRSVTDLSLDAHVLDLEAVVSRLELPRFVLAADGNGAGIVVPYAIAHPEMVSKLVLVEPVFRQAEVGARQGRAFEEMLRRDWEMFTDNVAALNFGWNRGDLSEYLRGCVDHKTALRIYGGMMSGDVTGLLPRLSAPTLIIHFTRARHFAIDAMRAAAATIAHAELVVLEGHWGSDMQAFASAINDFLAEGETASPAELPSGMTAILFADIADSTALTERLGDAAFRERARALDTALRTMTRENGGTPVEGKLLGDGVLAVFTSARQAIEAALACGRVGDEAGLPLHLGLHAGDVIREEGNVYGGAVNTAARISALSAPGEVLVSGTVRSLARTSAGVSFEDRGKRELKGVGEPVRVWAVHGEAS